MEGSPANFNEGDDQQTQHLILETEEEDFTLKRCRNKLLSSSFINNEASVGRYIPA